MAQPPTRVDRHLLLRRARQGSRPAAGGPRRPRARARRRPLERCLEGCRLSIKSIVKTFNNGSLGSGIDEERSEMR